MIVLLTVDVEAHRVIDEISGTARDSLGKILEELASHKLPGSFFVDVCGADTWGMDTFHQVCRRIQTAGHDIQLHVHPHHATRDDARWLLSSYSRAEQEEILTGAVSRFEEFCGVPPIAFRAGGFGANDDTLDLLRDKGIKIDSSYLWKRPGCEIRPPLRSAPARYRGITEIPLTPTIVVGTAAWPIRASSIDFNWLPLNVIKSILSRLRRAGAPVAVVLFHSSSMFIRTGRKRLMYWRGHERRLRGLFEFLAHERFDVRTITEAAPQLVSASDRIEDPPVVVLGLGTQYQTLLFQSLIGCGFNQRYRLFVLLHALALAALVLYCLLFIFI